MLTLSVACVSAMQDALCDARQKQSRLLIAIARTLPLCIATPDPYVDVSV